MLPDLSMLYSRVVERLESEIEFADISVIQGDRDDAFFLPFVIDALVHEFHKGVRDLGVKFAFNENDAIFIPLRKYYATALRLLLEDNAYVENDRKFQILRDQIGYNSHLHYYDTVLLHKIIDELDVRFLKSKDASCQEYFYSFVDRDVHYSFLNYNRASDRTKQLLFPELAEKDKEMVAMIRKTFTSQAERYLWDDNWMDEYKAKISSVFGYTARKELQENESHLTNFKDTADRILGEITPLA